jgi:CSLREA domain-containing protein
VLPQGASAAPATFTVDNVADLPSGSCVIAGQCTLRAAVQAANATSDAVIIVPAGIYTLDGGSGADTGDLQITKPVTIIGAERIGGAAATVVVGFNNRVFDIASPGVTIRGVVVTGGSAGVLGLGGGIRVRLGAGLTLETSTVRDNRALTGGGVFNLGQLTVDRSTISTNQADLNGGGLYNGGTATIRNSTISGNSAISGGGLISISTTTVIASTIALTQALRKVSVQYAKRVVGRKVYGGQTQYMPLKVNYAGVMPIIFAQAILLFPSTILNMAFPGVGWAQDLSNLLTHGWLHYVFYALMIFFFSYFWVATQFQPVQIADDLKKYGGFIPGVRPGKPTADFLDYTMTRLTVAGAIFLTAIAVLPQLLSQSMHVPYMTSQFFGGTGLLIIVGVVLDTMRQVETHLLQRHYDGFLRKGRIRSAQESRSRVGSGPSLSDSTIVWMWVAAGILVIAGVTIYFASRF